MADPPSWSGTVPPQLGGWRLDVVLAALVPDLTRAQAQRLLKAGLGLVNGERCGASERVPAGAALELRIEPPPTTVAAEAGEIEVLYRDARVMVANKPVGMVSHPARGTPGGTLLNALVALCGQDSRPSLVHRLDRDTSGALVVALDPAAHHGLKHQLDERRLKRTYWALVWGLPDPPRGRIEAPLDRDRGDKTRMCVAKSGKPAATRYQVLASHEIPEGTISLVEAVLETGRTHQVRVHLESIGHPLVGERVYRGRLGALREVEETLPGQCLHARRVAFSLPGSHEPLEVSAPLPTAWRLVWPDLFAA